MPPILTLIQPEGLAALALAALATAGIAALRAPGPQFRRLPVRVREDRK